MLGLMAERGFAEATRIAYVRGVLGLVERCGGRGPEAITVDEARAYVLWLKSSGATPALREARPRHDGASHPRSIFAAPLTRGRTAAALRPRRKTRRDSRPARPGTAACGPCPATGTHAALSEKAQAARTCHPRGLINT